MNGNISAHSGRKGSIGAIFRVTSGNFLEQFDFFLFGFYATHISRVFFPAVSEYASLMMTFAIFGAGFLMRPIGAIVLGSYIDKVGRRKGLIVTLSLMACGTLLIAFVPGYAQIGLLAPTLVLIGRLIQGFSAGAELGGVSVYLAEIATPRNKGFYTAWQSGSQQVSVMFAALLGYMLNLWMSSESMAGWGWRIPFLVGCAIIPLIFFLRRSLEETPEFEKRKHHPSMKEVLVTIGQNWKIVLAGMMLTAMTTTTFYLITVYTPTFGKTVLHLSTGDSLIVSLLAALSNLIWLPIGGALSDRIGRRLPMTIITILAILTCYPALSWLAQAPSFGRMLAVLLWFSFFFGIYNGAAMAALAEVMPEKVRVAGFSLAFSLATAVFGGFTPVVSTYLIQETGNRAAPAYWLMCAAICALISVTWIYKQRRYQQNQGIAFFQEQQK